MDTGHTDRYARVMSTSRCDVVVIGAGMGGLAAALATAGRGARVVVVDTADAPGGKLRAIEHRGRAIDSGPTVLTMRPVFEELFEAAGERLEDHVELRPLDVIARHLWPDGSQLDLFADEGRSADAVAAFAGASAADGFRRFCRYGEGLLDRLEDAFLRHDNEGLFGLMRRVGPRGLGRLAQVDFSRTMWRALGDFFPDPRLRQLFGRYATYYGSSPFEAPATMNLIAQVEARGVWAVAGGMIALGRAIADAIVAKGGELRLGCGASRIDRDIDGRLAVTLDDGARLSAAHVVFNGDPTRLVGGQLGPDVRNVVRPIGAPASLSAITWSTTGRATGVELAYHTVCFSKDYEAEFEALFERGAVPERPTVYVCAQDRLAAAVDGDERLFCLINAPASQEGRGATASSEEASWQERMLQSMRDCGVTLTLPSDAVRTTPQDFARRFPGTGGALYGSATHGALSPFRRYRVATKLPNLWMVGGAVHPGAGLPMVTLGGLLVAQRIGAALGSTLRSRGTGTSGGTSTPSTKPASARSR
jgi:1-hydroxycarotenoid 3,4-desaturase